MSAVSALPLRVRSCRRRGLRPIRVGESCESSKVDASPRTPAQRNRCAVAGSAGRQSRYTPHARTRGVPARGSSPGNALVWVYELGL